MWPSGLRLYSSNQKDPSSIPGVAFCIFLLKKRFLKPLWRIFAKKRNSHGHFKHLKNPKIIPRNCCFSVITLCSPKKFYQLILTLQR